MPLSPSRLWRQGHCHISRQPYSPPSSAAEGRFVTALLCAATTVKTVNHALTSANEQQRRATLRRWKLIALTLLLAAAAVFLLCSWWISTGTAPAWAGYVRAAAEAGMVGGLADWFAVTALFRHPMGLPIPHTALIPNNKDRVGDALSDFVKEQFLTPDALAQKVRDAQLPTWAAQQLISPGMAEKASLELGIRLASIIDDIDREEAAQLIRAHVIDKAVEPEWAPPAGRLLEAFIAEGKARPLEDDLIEWVHAKVLTMETQVISMIDERMPSWAPRFARDLVGDKVYRELVNFTLEMRQDANHEARLAFRRGLGQLAQDLQWEPHMRERIEKLKQEALSSPHMEAAPAAMWDAVARSLTEQLRDEHSFLRTKIAEKFRELAHRLLTDAQLLATVNGYVDKAARYAVEKFAPDIIAIIPETIKRWDATQASENIELMVGRDLQFIRLNGTVVGALAGLAIYTINHLIF